jgi:hypothetical protein
MRTRVELGEGVALQVVSETVGCACREGHCGERRILFDGGRKAGGVDDCDIAHAVKAVPAIEHAILGRGVHPDTTAIVGGPTWHEAFDLAFKSRANAYA